VRRRDVDGRHVDQFGDPQAVLVHRYVDDLEPMVPRGHDRVQVARVLDRDPLAWLHGDREQQP
jgi:hypothetical protein